MYYLYILECKNSSLYTGTTTHVEHRFQEHKSGTGGHHTHSQEVISIAYTEEYSGRSSALTREVQIKGWTRQKNK